MAQRNTIKLQSTCFIAFLKLLNLKIAFDVDVFEFFLA